MKLISSVWVLASVLASILVSCRSRGWPVVVVDIYSTVVRVECLESKRRGIVNW